MGKYMTDSDWKHSKFFRKEEFRCNCGKCSGYPKNGISKSLVDNMNLLRQIRWKTILREHINNMLKAVLFPM